MIFDAVVLAAILISAIIAFLRGFIREFLTIVGVVGGLAASYFGGPALQPVMRSWLGVREVAEGEEPQKLFDLIPMTIVADICAYGSIFLVVVIILTVLSHFLATGVKAIGLGPVDRLLGIAFGVVRAVLVLALLYLFPFILTTEADRDEWFKGSYTRPTIEKATAWMAERIPEVPAEKTEDAAGKAAEKAAEKIDEMGKELEKIDMIRNAAEKADQALEPFQKEEPVPPQPAPAPADSEGYKPEQRESLDQLIETNQNP
ncbi:MAG: CvpA family protein [Micavibrio sp.]